MAPTGQESGQDCDGAYGQAPMRSLLTWSVGGLGRLENEVDRSPERHCAGPITGQTRAEEPRERLSQSLLLLYVSYEPPVVAQKSKPAEDLPVDERRIEAYQPVEPGVVM